MNPAIYLVSILPGLSVWLLLRPEGKSLAALCMATVAVVLAQHAINLLNDVADWRLGADVEKWDSWVRFHDENIGIAKLHGWLSFVASGILGIACLIWIDRLWILIVALPLIGLGYLYNSGSKPLSYTRLGEWVTALCYGGVFACLGWVAGMAFGGYIILGSIAFASLATALLLSHQPGQIETDTRVGKRSFAVRFGVNKTHQAIRILFFVFLLSWNSAWAISGPDPSLLTISLIASVLAGCNEPNPKYLLLSVSALFGMIWIGLLV